MIAAPFSFWFLLISTALAVGLGVFHALESGHRKEIGGYLTGFRPGARRAARFGIMVVATRVAGLYLVGVLVLYASQYLVPEQLYSWLNAISGLAIAGIGLLVLLRNFSGVIRQHSHAGGKNHSHWFLPGASEHADPDIARAGERQADGCCRGKSVRVGHGRNRACWLACIGQPKLVGDDDRRETIAHQINQPQRRIARHAGVQIQRDPAQRADR